jgi:hypothetical protein
MMLEFELGHLQRCLVGYSEAFFILRQQRWLGINVGFPFPKFDTSQRAVTASLYCEAYFIRNIC